MYAHRRRLGAEYRNSEQSAMSAYYINKMSAERRIVKDAKKYG